MSQKDLKRMLWGFVFLHNQLDDMTSTFCKHLHLPNPYYVRVAGQLNSSGFHEPLVNWEKQSLDSAVGGGWRGLLEWSYSKIELVIDQKQISDGTA